MQAKRCTEVCPHLSVFQLAKGFNAPDYSNIHSNSIDSDIPENILLGMNISDRYDYGYYIYNNSPKCTLYETVCKTYKINDIFPFPLVLVDHIAY